MNNENSSGSSNQPENAAKRRPRKRIIIPILLLLIIAAICALYWYQNLRGYVSTDDAYIESDQVDVGSKILGRIVLLNCDEGDTVQQGALLVQLDDSDLRAQEAQAQANLDYTQQNVALARVGLQRAQEDFDRAAVQFRDKVIPQEPFDHARKALDMAQAQLNVALAQVNTSRAQLNVVETQLRNTQILAPATGAVARRWVVPGDVVQPGQPIFTVYDLQHIWVRANLEETKIGKIHIADPVQIEVDAYPDRSFIGKVSLIGAAAASQFSLIPPNNASGNFTKVTQRVPLKITIDDLQSGQQHEPPLLPGMSVVIKIRVNQR